MSLSAESFEHVADLVLRRSAIRLAPGKEYLVETRLLGMARERGLADVEELVRQVRASGTEADRERIVEELTTNETSWFRDQLPFESLREHVLPRIVAERGPAARVRVWSAACSTGQEPYSIAMTAAEVLPPTASVEILATDLSDQVLAQARSGTYSQLEINRGMPASMMVRHLVRSGAQWQVNPDLRRSVTFRKHNLLDMLPLGPFDIVFLRNVLIYFDVAVKHDILRRVARVMAPGGVLVLGSAETVFGMDGEWSRVQAGRGSLYVVQRPATGAVPSVATGMTHTHRAAVVPALARGGQE
ncbi:chemotaxis protein CheR [Xylanimonas oleitrophica]|uniref:protein-glutamate O-methyltransferase n=1 Tax=Xylanimonas oleitrophica TaxID=2607479 RepID=A0A2W5WU54_9MICO|nr:protein-glutamate O-methyltransferase CheR [Xylanimonas oleitrophica]PZR54153.1 chemotaxis protein CheR [Xylanimonas oleitrophica]